MNTVPVVIWRPAVGEGAQAADLNTAIRELYDAHYQSLVRLAAMLVRDTGTAEEVVQDAFVALYRTWSGLRDTGKARSYLHQSVVNGARSVLRHRAVAEKHAPALALHAAGADQAALALVEGSAVVAALRVLPARQREALVLRFYADFSEADVAKAMSISRGAVKSHTARGVAALRKVLGDAASPCLWGSGAVLPDHRHGSISSFAGRRAVA